MSEPWFAALRTRILAAVASFGYRKRRAGIAAMVDAIPKDWAERQTPRAWPVGNSGRIAIHSDGLVLDAFRQAETGQPEPDA